MKTKLIAYASERLPDGARNYSITELEMYRLAINIASFSHLLKRVDFDAIVDHLTLIHIIKSKAELAATRIKRLLELVSSYSINLCYIKWKDMSVSNFCPGKSMIIVINIKLYQFHLICKIYCMLDITT